jgi:hypothetical protein
VLCLLACGPSVGGADEDPGSTSAEGSTGVTTIDPTNGTSATTASTSATTASTSATTTASTSATVGTFGDDTSGDATDDDTGVPFLIDPDWGGPLCSSLSFCDVWAQDCPRGSKCMPWDCPGGDEIWSSTTCSALDPNPAGIGEPCTIEESLYSGTDNCDIAAMCWDADPDTLVGECVAFCSGSEANPLCEDPATACFMGWDGVIIVCLPRCDPLASECAADEECMFDAASSLGDFVCMPEVHVGPQAYGDDCSDALGCGTGLICREAAHVPGCVGTSCCTTLGDETAPPVCPDVTQTCLPLVEAALPSHEDLCFCGVAE